MDIDPMPSTAADSVAVLHDITKLTTRSIKEFRQKAGSINSLPINAQMSLRGEAVERYLATGRAGLAPLLSSEPTALVTEAINRRQSYRRYTSCEERGDASERLLAAIRNALEIKTTVWTKSRPEGARAYFSAGALYTVDHHLLWRFRDNCYRLGLFSPFLGQVIYNHDKQFTSAQVAEMTPIPPQALMNCMAIVIQSSRLNIALKKYGPRAYRFVLLEAGMAAQTLALSSEAYGLGTSMWGGFIDDVLSKLLDPHNASSVPLNLITVGFPGEPEGDEM